jgi:hypothetical protein
MMNIPDINHGSLHVLMGDENNHQWPLRGVVDDVCIFNRALSAKEIQFLHRESLPSENLVLTETSTTNNSGLIAHWTFDEGTGEITQDLIGQNNGKIHGARWTEGKSGNALRFDGMYDFVSLALPAIKTKNFSLAAWARTDGVGNGAEHSNPIFCQRSKDTTDNQSTIYLIAPSTGDYKMRASGTIRSSQGSKQDISSQPLGFGQWHFYILTVDTDKISFYVDGKEVERTANNQKGDYISSIDYTVVIQHLQHIFHLFLG